MKHLILIMTFLISAHACAEILFQEASRLALEHEKLCLPEFRSKMLRSYTQTAGPLISKCLSENEGGDLSAFNMVFQLGGDGEVMATWLNKETPIAVCFESQLKKAKFISPPQAGFYYEAAMGF